MESTIAMLSPKELEQLITRVIDQRMRLWLRQILDSLHELDEEDELEFREEFELSLQQALEEVRTGNVTTLAAFREELLNG